MNSRKEETRTAGAAEEALPRVEAGSVSHKVEREYVATASGDIVEAQLDKLRSLFPEVFVEGTIDFDKVRGTLGAAAEQGPGRFHFSRAGKDDAVRLLQTPSCATLIQCPEESVDFETTGKTSSVSPSRLLRGHTGREDSGALLNLQPR